MNKIAEVRLTLAAFIYSIEADLKDLLLTKVVTFQSNLDFFRDNDLVDRTIKRFQKDNPGIDYLQNLNEVVGYIDFADAFTILLKNKSFLEDNYVKELQEIRKKFEELIPIRNRVMHTRPLLGGDFSTVYSFITEIERVSILPWSQTKETKRKIETDPSYVLTLSIPSYKEDTYDIYNNLPLPDFDESGFIGRVKDVEDIKKLILSNNRVVSIIGDGGIGKTALTVKIAYDLLDMQEGCPFDMILWTSAKTTMLTAQGIQDISNSLNDFTGLVEVLSDAIEEPKTNFKDNLDEIIEHFKVFNVLLIIDNLETIHNENIRKFIREAQQYCKIIITSRIGLGELEYPRRLKGFNEVEATRLIREIAKMRNSDVLLQLSHKSLIEISKKLYFNPLAIKWFVNSVEAGLTPNEVLNSKGDLLNFCLSNVYDKLSIEAKQILNILLSARKALNDAELIYLIDLEPLKVKLYLNELLKTSFIEREIFVKNESQEVVYSVPEFAKEYLLKQTHLNKVYFKSINTKLRQLSKQITDIRHSDEFNELGVNSITYRNTNEKIVARFLTEALKLSKKGFFDTALEKINNAKKIAPQFFEIYRVGAFIKVANEDYLGADNDYKLGLEIEPDNPRLIFYYAQFLLFQMSDVDLAIEYADKLNKLRPNHPYIVFLYSRCYATISDYENAISLIQNLLTNNKNLSTKDKRIAITDIISHYSYWASEKVKIEEDYFEAIKLFKKSLEIFENSIDNELYDFKTIKTVCNSLIHFVSLIPLNYNENNIEYLKDFFYKYENYINMTTAKEIIIHRFRQNYDIYLKNNLDTTDRTEYNHGFLDNCVMDRAYCFIEGQDKRCFAHKTEFKQFDDWYNRKNGQFVTYIESKNEKGFLAKDIVVIQSEKQNL